MFESSLRGTRADDDARAARAATAAGRSTGNPAVIPAAGSTPPSVLDRLDELAGSLAEVSAAADQCAAWTGP